MTGNSADPKDMPHAGSNGKHIYFKNLHGLRAVAALLVIVHHIEQFKNMLGVESYWNSLPFVAIVGKLGVVLFFVLSGFLITYLLLAEERSFGAIDVRSFYVRRILRIWPLYFLIVFLAMFILPCIDLLHLPAIDPGLVTDDRASKFLLYLFFLPNMVLAEYGPVPYASHTWSIGTEEQFYLLWPLLLLLIRKGRMVLMVVVVVVYLIILKALFTDHTTWLPIRDSLQRFWVHFNIDCMAIGGFFAVLQFYGHFLLKVFKNNLLFYITLVIIVIMMALGIKFAHLHFEIYASLFGILILNFASNPRIGISLENKPMRLLGDISYGLYMYHPITIVLTIKAALRLGITSNWLLYPAAIMITILVAWLSYNYFERWFLGFKKRFTRVPSGTPQA